MSYNYISASISISDYYPFGMLMPNRHGEDDSYRYGFNGKENDDEVKGIKGTQQDYGFRIYDVRVNRFLTTDPLKDKFPWLSTYQFASNTPIMASDLDGLEAKIEIITIDAGKTKIIVKTAADFNSKSEWRDYQVLMRNAFGNSSAKGLWVKGYDDYTSYKGSSNNLTELQEREVQLNGGKLTIDATGKTTKVSYDHILYDIVEEPDNDFSVLEYGWEAYKSIFFTGNEQSPTGGTWSNVKQANQTINNYTSLVTTPIVASNLLKAKTVVSTIIASSSAGNAIDNSTSYLTQNGKSMLNQADAGTAIKGVISTAGLVSSVTSPTSVTNSISLISGLKSVATCTLRTSNNDVDDNP